MASLATADSTGSSSSSTGTTKLKIDGADVPITAEAGVDVAVAINSTPFKDWLALKDKTLAVKAIHFQGIDMFGKRPGFIKFKADVNVDGLFVPGIVFMRGGAVAVLVVLKCEGKSYTLLTLQPRVPIGQRWWPEIPAGMLDGSGKFAGVAAKEMKEETGLELEASALVDMTELVYGSKPGMPPGLVPSAGGCDEFIRLFCYTKEVTKAELEALEGKCTGCRDEGELITLKVVPLDTLWQEAPDGKTLAAVLLYEKLTAAGKL